MTTDETPQQQVDRLSKELAANHARLTGTTPTPASAAAQATPITDKAWSEYDGMRMTSTELRIIMARLERENADLAAALERLNNAVIAYNKVDFPSASRSDDLESASKQAYALIAAHKKGAQG